jgi:hypothetical protein
MPNPILYPNINGTRYSFASITLLGAGLVIPGFIDIDYGNEVDSSMVYGTNPQPLGATRGQLKSSAKFTMLQLEYYNYIEALCVLNGTPGSGYLEVRHDIQVQYQDGSGITLGPLITDVIRGFRLKKPGRSFKAGPEALAVSCEGDCFYIAENGKLPFGVNPASVNGFTPG